MVQHATKYTQEARSFSMLPSHFIWHECKCITGRNPGMDEISHDTPGLHSAGIVWNLGITWKMSELHLMAVHTYTWYTHEMELNSICTVCSLLRKTRTLLSASFSWEWTDYTVHQVWIGCVIFRSLHGSQCWGTTMKPELRQDANVCKAAIQAGCQQHQCFLIKLNASKLAFSISLVGAMSESLLNR